MKSRPGAAAAAVVIGLLASACLLKEERHVLYLDPVSTAVTWVVFEHDVRSNEEEPADRLEEESEYWNTVQAQGHPAARAFRALGASTIRTLHVRSEVPFSIVTDATFPGIEELGRRFIEELGATGTSVLTREGDMTVWTATLRPPAEDRETDVSGLSAADTVEVVLTSGRFESAVGFKLEQAGRIAILDGEQFGMDEDAEVVVSLRWTLAKEGAEAGRPSPIR